MANDLSEIKDRLEYAGGEIVAVHEDVLNYISLNPLESQTKLIEDKVHFQLRCKTPVPFRIRAKTGTAIHEIRSCLDVLACRLAERNGKTAKNVYFPISKDREAFENDGKNKLSKLSDSDRQKIIDLSPHADADPFLFGMHDFDRTRKHNKLGLSAVAQGKTMMHWMGKNSEQPVKIITGQLIGSSWKTVMQCNADDNVSMGCTFCVSFAEPEQLNGLEIIDAMKRFMMQVEGIILMFD